MKTTTYRREYEIFHENQNTESGIKPEAKIEFKVQFQVVANF